MFSGPARALPFLTGQADFNSLSLRVGLSLLTLHAGAGLRPRARPSLRPQFKRGPMPITRDLTLDLTPTFPPLASTACSPSWPRLRDPETGCPWDIQQTFATIAPYTLEEAHEVADAIDRQAWDELRGELGDLLFQTVYHAQMADEAGHFTFADVVTAISDKMIARHPHVFGDRNPRQDRRTADPRLGGAEGRRTRNRPHP